MSGKAWERMLAPDQCIDHAIFDFKLLEIYHKLRRIHIRCIVDKFCYCSECPLMASRIRVQKIRTGCRQRQSVPVLSDWKRHSTALPQQYAAWGQEEASEIVTIALDTSGERSHSVSICVLHA